VEEVAVLCTVTLMRGLIENGELLLALLPDGGPLFLEVREEKPFRARFCAIYFNSSHHLQTLQDPESDKD